MVPKLWPRKLNCILGLQRSILTLTGGVLRALGLWVVATWNLHPWTPPTKDVLPLWMPFDDSLGRYTLDPPLSMTNLNTLEIMQLIQSPHKDGLTFWDMVGIVTLWKPSTLEQRWEFCPVGDLGDHILTPKMKFGPHRERLKKLWRPTFTS